MRLAVVYEKLKNFQLSDTYIYFDYYEIFDFRIWQNY